RVQHSVIVPAAARDARITTLRRFGGESGLGRNPADGTAWKVDFEIVNFGRSRVQLSELRLAQAVEGGGSHGWDASAKAELPRWLDVGELATGSISSSECFNADLSKPF